MTAQISDSIWFEGEDYAVAGVNGAGLFQPEEYGLSPRMMSTACQRGFFCHYRVVERLLRLQSLHISLDMKPMLKAKHAKGPELFGGTPRFNESDYCLDYENLGRPIGFTGGLLIGADFISKMAVNMGFHSAYKFRRVHELVFGHGELLKVTNLSQEMAQFRERIVAQPLESAPGSSRQDIKQWIDKCFNLDYKLPFEP